MAATVTSRPSPQHAAFHRRADVEPLQPEDHQLPPDQQRGIPVEGLAELKVACPPAERVVKHQQHHADGHGHTAQVVLLEQEVVKGVGAPHPRVEPGGLGEEDVQAPGGPAVLLVEVGRPRRRALSDGQRQGNVNALPALRVDALAGGQVFGQVALVPANLLQRADADDVIRADEQGHLAPAQRPEDRTVEQVGLTRGAPGDQIVHVSVDLRGADKRDPRVPEVAESLGQEIPAHLEVAIDLRHEIIVPAVRDVPGIVIAALALGQEDATLTVQAFDSVPGEIFDAEPRA